MEEWLKMLTSEDGSRNEDFHVLLALKYPSGYGVCCAHYVRWSVE